MGFILTFILCLVANIMVVVMERNGFSEVSAYGSVLIALMCAMLYLTFK